MKKLSILFLSVFAFLSLNAQQVVNRDTILVAAKEIIKETTYCALVTLDSTGQPQIRTMNPFPMKDGEIEIWFATSRSSRKASEIKNNPNVCVYWADHVYAKGYVNITGTAEVIDDKELLVKMKREYWEGMPNWKDVFVLIKITPRTLEVINYKHGLNNDPVTFKAPWITL
ncbi:MAG TPA: pyridoxamine 5'-phosphate oxidase family protein [Bacteroidales bacterium]|jgi:general stress protein 26|nr:pyridoxamine 5'-phosphate oxidase family protein [Bacteroidales bacterium]